MKKTPREQRGDVRVKLAERQQVEMRCLSLDQLIRDDALVRTVVAFAETIDLSELYASMQATRHTTGRSNIDPRILFSMWLFATLEGINSARRIDELATRDVAYMWICGGVSVNYHTIADFRSNNAELLERCLTDSIATLHREDLVRLETIAQDGMRVRASAGSGSFRRKKSLDEAKQVAQEFYDRVCNRDDDDDENDSPNPGSKAARKRAARKRAARKRAARKRAAREKLERIEAAGDELAKMQDAYEKRNARVGEKNRRSEPRASTTDPEARRMKMGDNGTRAAFNSQFASDVDTQVIVQAGVCNVGSDAGQMQPMYDSVCATYGSVPSKYLADGGFSKKAGVTHVERNGTAFYGPLYNEQKELDSGNDPYAPRKGEDEFYTSFRQRMGTQEAKDIYRQRAAAAEFPNATCRNQGLHQFSVRGLLKGKVSAIGR